VSTFDPVAPLGHRAGKDRGYELIQANVLFRGRLRQSQMQASGNSLQPPATGKTIILLARQRYGAARRQAFLYPHRLHLSKTIDRFASRFSMRLATGKFSDACLVDCIFRRMDNDRLVFFIIKLAAALVRAN
jgi:hypothetical protein